jgi:hypothetical protein
LGLNEFASHLYEREIVIASDPAPTGGLSWKLLRSLPAASRTTCTIRRSSTRRSRSTKHKTSHVRDKLLLAGVRLLAGRTKMPGERDCFARSKREYNK